MIHLADNFAQTLMAKGKKVQASGPAKFEAQCPNHSDRAKSLSIAEGDDGRLLLHCHAGCAVKDIASAAGWTVADMFPKDTGGARVNGNGPANGNGHKPKPAWPTIQGAIDAAGRSVARAEEIMADAVRYAAHWIYCDAGGAEVGAVVRFDLPTVEGEKQRKSFRPLRRDVGGWVIGDPAGKWPLFRRPQLAGVTRVWLTEGEKAAGAGESCGLDVTTSAHGAKSANKTDWQLPEAAEWVILPDHDDAGETYAAEAAAEIHRANPMAMVKVVRLAELAGDAFPRGGDLYDFTTEFRDGQDADTIRAELEAAADGAEPITFAPAPSPAPTPTPGPRMNDSARLPSMRTVSSVERKPIEWIWHRNFARGKLSLLYGDPGLGKSFLTLFMATTVSNGWQWPDGSWAPQGKAILIGAEDDVADTVAPRLDAMGADTAEIVVLDGSYDRDQPEAKKGFTLADIPTLRAALVATPGCVLVVIDPVSAYLSDRDSHNNAEIRGMLMPLNELAAEFSVAIVMVTHLNKSGGGKSMYRATGSLAFVAAARSAWIVIRDPLDHDRRYLLPVKNNVGNDRTGFAFRIVDGVVDFEMAEVTQTADEIMRAEAAAEAEASPPGPEPTARNAAAEWLAAFLKGGPRLVGECEDEGVKAGFSKRTIRRAREGMRVVSEPRNFGQGWAWRLVDEG